MRQPWVTPWIVAFIAVILGLAGWLAYQAVVSGKHRLGYLEGATIAAGAAMLLVRTFFQARAQYGDRDGQMVLTVDDSGIYLKEAERLIDWPMVAEVVTFRALVSYPEGVL